MGLLDSGDFGIGSIISTVFILVLFLFYPRIMLSQALLKLENTARMIENFTAQGKKIVLKRISKNPSKEIKESVNNFLEFFVIEPVSLDPYGIMRKIEHLVNLSESRFKHFVSQTAPDLNEEEQMNLVMGLSGAISLNQVAKVVRHFVELVRKTKNWQLAAVLQMSMPMIEKIAKALLDGTEALTNGWPIGDAAGSFVAARMIDKEKLKLVDDQTVLVKKKIKGRKVYIIKARGPGGRLGKLGITVERIIKREKVAKVITIDAAAKLEGEKTGTVAEGVGVAIGGPGVDRSYIENITTAKTIPLDSFVIKMSQEEAIQPIRKEILLALPKVDKMVEENIAKTKERGSIVVVGVGNTAGVGNDRKAAVEAEEHAKKVLQIVKQREKEKERKGIFRWFFGS